MYSIVHISPRDKFISSFIELVNSSFDSEEHLFVILENKNNYSIINSKNILIQSSLVDFYTVIKFIKSAKKLILHSIPPGRLPILLFFFRKYLNKSYWIIWGWDLYSYEFIEQTIKKKLVKYIRDSVIGNVKFLVSYVPGDYELAKKVYGAKGEYIECIMYPSNVFNLENLMKTEHPKNEINILIGNSASESNHHFELFEILECYKNENIKIIAPLSYGNKEYGSKVIEIGKKYFANKFVPLTDFIPLDEYNRILQNIDIAVFNHDRQQAMGNIINLLGLGKKVYMRNSVTSYKLLEELEIVVFDINNFNLQPISQKISKENHNKIKKYFSKTNLIKQLSFIFDQVPKNKRWDLEN